MRAIVWISGASGGLDNGTVADLRKLDEAKDG
jgi:hypothetical protein